MNRDRSSDQSNDDEEILALVGSYEPYISDEKREL
jgi:hypothetical protein